MLLANRIWDKIKDEYPNVYLGYYSYAQYEDYPSRYTPNSHLAVIFAPINFSRFHSLLDPHSKSQTYYLQVVEKSHKLAEIQGNQLIFRGYNFNRAEGVVPSASSASGAMKFLSIIRWASLASTWNAKRPGLFMDRLTICLCASPGIPS